MSLFNLDRFRFHKEPASCSSPNRAQRPQEARYPAADKENCRGPHVKPGDHHGSGKIQRRALDEMSSDDEVVKKGTPVWQPTKKSPVPETQTDPQMEEKLVKLMRMFPQASKRELLDILENTSTLKGAVAQCMLLFKDEDSDTELFTRKRKNHRSDDGIQPNKRIKAEETASEETPEPSQKKQKALLKKIKKNVPEMDESLLMDVLREHDWDYENTLGSLLMFSEPDSKSDESPKKSVQSSDKPKPARPDPQPNSSLSRWLSSASSKSSNASNKGGRAANAKSDKTDAAEHDGDSEGPDDEVESGDEFSSEEEDEEDFSSTDREQILQFLQQASLDEITLISGCSLKKANKIISLRPFKTWKAVNERFIKDNGLSMELMHGCKMVLKEREALKRLMTRCEGIANQMTSDITQVIENGKCSMKQPSVLNSKLKLQPYQLIGLKWLILLHQHKLSGILADEMGLGKTIQAISFLGYLLQNGMEGPHLITVPSSTVDNWVRELQLWCPKLKVIVYCGSMEDRKYLRHDILNNAVEFNVIVSTYNLTVGNENDRSLFRKLKLQYAVFDEGHMLKNMNSLRYRHLMSINAKWRLLLTGTPLQNNLLELISLLNFIMPSMFSTSTSKISKMFSTKSVEEESSFHKDRISQAKLIMKPFILRRVKTEVLKELPPKVEKVEMCPMSNAQQQLYEKLFNRLKKNVNKPKQELCNVMMQLRKMANHPLLHRQYYTTEKLKAMSKAMLREPTHFDADAALIQEDMEVLSDFELHNLCKEYSSISRFQLERDLLLDSGKFDLLTELLADLKKKGDRVVLFSQFTMMLDIVEVLLNHLGHQFVRLDGSTPVAERIGLIDKYNTDQNVFIFLLSTRAGGQGINLASANVVILHDIDCNPFNDKQAEDRCHRMGQTRTVRVIKLVSKGSIEACMLRVGQEKLKLEQDMTTDEGDEGSMSEDMAELLKASLGL